MKVINVLELVCISSAFLCLFLLFFDERSTLSINLCSRTSDGVNSFYVLFYSLLYCLLDYPNRNFPMEIQVAFPEESQL